VSEPTIVVEAVEAADEDVADQLRRVQRLSYLFDDSIPLPGGYSIGFDPIVGPLPVVGDVAASAVSVYIVMEAVDIGVPRETLARMPGNVVDTVAGSLPVVGDLFDAAFKANARKVRLLEHRMDDRDGARADRRVLVAVSAALAPAGTSVVSASRSCGWSARSGCSENRRNSGRVGRNRYRWRCIRSAERSHS
jgi:hypothetical protein